MSRLYLKDYKGLTPVGGEDHFKALFFIKSSSEDYLSIKVSNSDKEG